MLTFYPDARGARIGRPWPVEVALWDVIGQATGQPVYGLLGGADRQGCGIQRLGRCPSLQAGVLPPLR